jgi:ankyrin repeat protein
MTNVNVTDKYKQTPLHIAATMGLNDLILNLISKGAKTTLKDYRGYTPYDIAKDNINIDRAILDKMEPPKENIDSKKSFMEINKFSNKNRDEGSIYIRNSSFETENENRHNKRVPENSTVNVGY